MKPTGIIWKQGTPPREPGVYYVAKGEEALYVGCAQDLRGRVNSHKSSPWYRLLLKEGVALEWRWYPTRRYYLTSSDDDQILVACKSAWELEGWLIDLWRPMLNCLSPKHTEKRKTAAIANLINGQVENESSLAGRIAKGVI